MTKFSAIWSRIKVRKEPVSEDLEVFRDIADDVIESDFVPYACLADTYSIFTKNGEVLQILRIPANAHAARGDVRQALREALFASIPDTGYALWIHTIRRRKRLNLPAGSAAEFSRQLDEEWNRAQQWDTGLGNELYISIVRVAQPADLADLHAIKNSFWPTRDIRLRNAYLDKAAKELTVTVDALLGRLSDFGATRLGIVTRDGVSYSEQLEFLESLINLEFRPMPVPDQDLSHYLTSGNITFGFNAMEVRTAEGKRRFAAILTIKEYKECSLRAIDQFLELPCELIVTQSFDFIGAEEAKAVYEKYARYLELGGDQEMAEWSEIPRLMTHKDRPSKAYGEQQCSLFLIAPNLKTLEANIKLVTKALHRIGIVAFREDLKLEQMYWAQLPGNFPFIVRNWSVNSMHVGGFASLKADGTSSANQSHWGLPVALLPTREGAPYYLHFHQGRTGHTSIIGSPHAGRTTLAHFLLAQAQRLAPRLWYFDTRGRAQSFITALGGAYQRPGSDAMPINPLKLPDSPANREFLTLWLASVLDPDGQQLSRHMMEFFEQLLAGFMPLDPALRSFSVLRDAMKQVDPVLASQLNPWAAGGLHGGILDGSDDRFAAATIQGFDLSQVAATRGMRNAVTSYLLHRLTMALDGAPTILVLDEGFLLLDDLLFGPRAATWLEYLAKTNCMVVLLTGQPAVSAALSHTPAIQAHMINRFFLPEARPGSFYTERLGLPDALRSQLTMHTRDERLVMLVQGGRAEWLRVNLAGVTPVLRDALAGQSTAAQVQAGAADASMDATQTRELV